MKFKSNLKSEAPVDFSALEQDINTLLNVNLCEAAENLDDLVLLHANIEKYGITEPVMDLIGGTLESWNISIQNKEACLEGLGDKLKEGSKKVWEFIKQLVDKIITFIKGIINKHDPKEAKEISDTVKKFQDKGLTISMQGIPDKKFMKDIADFASGNDVDWSGEHMVKMHKLLFKINDAGNIEISDELVASMDDAESNYKKKGYSTPQDVIQTTMIEADSSVKKIGKLCDYLRNEVFKNERLYAARNILNESENKSVEYFLKGSKDCLSGCMKLATILNRVYTSGKSYGQKFHESEKEQTNN